MIINDIKYNGPAIYSIYNTVSEKLYIGKTSHYRDRIQEHKSRLNNNKHCNDYLQKSFNLHKEDIVTSILETCKIEDLCEREIFWIKFLDTINRDKGYNLTPGGEGSVGVVWTEERKQKCRESNRKFLDSEAGLELRQRRREHIKNREVHPRTGRITTEEDSKRISKKLKETYKKKKAAGWVPKNGTRIEVLDEDGKVVGKYNSIMTIDPVYNINPESVLAKIGKWKRKGRDWTEMGFRFVKYTIRKV